MYTDKSCLFESTLPFSALYIVLAFFFAPLQFLDWYHFLFSSTFYKWSKALILVFMTSLFNLAWCPLISTIFLYITWLCYFLIIDLHSFISVMIDCFLNPVTCLLAPKLTQQLSWCDYDNERIHGHLFCVLYLLWVYIKSDPRITNLMLIFLMEFSHFTVREYKVLSYDVSH